MNRHESVAGQWCISCYRGTLMSSVCLLLYKDAMSNVNHRCLHALHANCTNVGTGIKLYWCVTGLWIGMTVLGKFRSSLYISYAWFTCGFRFCTWNKYLWALMVPEGVGIAQSVKWLTVIWTARRSRDFPLSHCIRTGFGIVAASYLVITGG
jgi:hypothetical protein